MVLVLAGMVGWLYWQQSRLFQNMNSIVMVIGELARPSPVPTPELEMVSEVVIPEFVKEEEEAEEEDDDRVSVEEEGKVDIVDGLDTDGLESKTTKELRDILTKRGIPFGKRDSKSVLISLLKATS